MEQAASAEQSAAFNQVTGPFPSAEPWPTVRPVRAFEHPMCEQRDLFNLVVECPHCAQTHVHGPVHCVRGRVDAALNERTDASLASCARGKYHIDQSCVQALIDRAAC